MSASEATKLKRIRSRDLRITIRLLRLVSVLMRSGDLPESRELSQSRELQLAKYEAELATRNARDARDGKRQADPR
jgi:hypothetical protein